MNYGLVLKDNLKKEYNKDLYNNVFCLKRIKKLLH